MRFTIYFILLLVTTICYAQIPAGPMPLEIGDKVPDIRFNRVLNTSYTSTSLLPPNKKLLLVDFWATWCTGCIKEFPKLDSLQSQFDGKLEFLLVTSTDNKDNEIGVSNFFKKLTTPNGKKYTLPVLIENGQLKKLFPHIFIPHTVWIYGGKVIGITDASQVTAKNIQAVLNNTNIYLSRKEDRLDFDSNIPLMQAGNGANYSALISRSTFVRYIKGIGGVGNAKVDIENGTAWRWSFFNYSVLGLYKFTYPSIPTNRLILEDNLTANLILPKNPDSAWVADNFICYELTMPARTSLEEKYRKMRKDFDQQFGLSSKIESRSVPCFALVILKDSIATFKAKGQNNKKEFSKTLDGMYHIYNQELSTLITEVNHMAPGKPIIPILLDETGYKGLVDLNIKINNIHDLPELKKALVQYGLDIVPVTRELDMIVISKVKIN